MNIRRLHSGYAILLLAVPVSLRADPVPPGGEVPEAPVDSFFEIQYAMSDRAMQDPRVRNMAALLEADFPHALGIVTGRIGLEPPAGAKVYLRLSQDANARAYASPLPGGRGSVITFNVNKMIEDGADRHPEVTFRHELTHALQQMQMDIRTYQTTVPDWFREGSAVYAASEWPRWTNVCFIKSRGRDIRGGLDGVERGGRSGPYNMLESYLALHQIEKTAGPDGVRDLMRRIFVDKVPFRTAIERTTGLSYADWCVEAQRFAHAYAMEAWPAGADRSVPVGRWTSTRTESAPDGISVSRAGEMVITDRFTVAYDGDAPILPETLRVWVVEDGRNEWIWGSPPVHGERLEAVEGEEGVWQAEIRVDLSPLRAHSASGYFLWYLVHTRDRKLLYHRLPLEVTP